MVEQGTEKTNNYACPIQAMADVVLRYLRFLLFNPKPMNQQEETEITENGKQKLKWGKAVAGRIQEIVAADGSRR